MPVHHAGMITETTFQEQVEALEEDVLRYLDGESVLAYEERWYERIGRWLRRYQLWISLLLMYLLMRVLVALIR